MKQGKMHYLNFRTLCAWSFMVLFLAALLGYLIYEKISGNGAGWFPVIFGGCLLVLGICYAVVEIWLPYRRIEKRIELFLDGYTTSNLVGEDGIHISPELESLVSKMQYLMQSQEMLNLNKRQAQYLALQNQINPHFLYNTLESIRSEALIAGLVSVADMTEALATFFRYTRDEKSRTFSSNSKRSHILRTSSRSIRLILSSIVSFAVSLKWTRTI